MDPTYAALRRATALAARQHDHGAWREQSLVLADYLEETGEDQAAQRRRALVTRKRSPGCQWPRVSRIAGLSDHQREVLACTLTRPFAVLCGTPGTGKTYCTAAIIRALGWEHQNRIAVAAPTGKAAVRITEALARSHNVHHVATTIHQLLEVGRDGFDGDGWGFHRHATCPLEDRFIIIDEASMLDTDLAAALFSACGPGTHILLVGDPYQLPPVGHGAPLRDLIASGAVPVGHLTEIRRNAGMIVHTCAAIKDNRRFEAGSVQDGEHNLVHYECAHPEEQIKMLLAILTRFQQTYEFDPVWETQVLAPLNTNSPLSRGHLNLVLQSHFNPDGKRFPESNPFAQGDKVICLRNNTCFNELRLHAPNRHDTLTFVANGEIARVCSIDRSSMHIRLECPDREVIAGYGGKTKSTDNSGSVACTYDLAYAITGHKAQGSEWPCVILMIDSSPSARRVCSREWVYTAISRASKLCITIGRMGVLQQMCRRPSLENRKTFLRELLTKKVASCCD